MQVSITYESLGNILKHLQWYLSSTTTKLFVFLICYFSQPPMNQMNEPFGFFVYYYYDIVPDFEKTPIAHVSSMVKYSRVTCITSGLSTGILSSEID